MRQFENADAVSACYKTGAVKIDLLAISFNYNILIDNRSAFNVNKQLATAGTTPVGTYAVLVEYRSNDDLKDTLNVGAKAYIE